MTRSRHIKRHLSLLLILFCQLTAMAGSSPKIKYPGGPCYIFRLTLTDKHDSPYSLDHPGRWLSHRSVERRRHQGILVDSTDLPVNPRYVRLIERTAHDYVKERGRNSVSWTLVGTSRWNNTVLVRANDTILFERLAKLPFVNCVQRVWTAPDSIPRSVTKVNLHKAFEPWDSVPGELYGNGKQQIEMLGGHRLHNIGKRGKGITIAVLDGGFQNVDRIPAFQSIDIQGYKDFVFPNSNHFFLETDHGTRVVSAMAANEPQVLVGTAPEARYWLLRCEDQQSEQPVEEDYWAMAAEFADSVGADIISSSLGYNEFDSHWGDYHQRDLNGQLSLISRTASMLANKGIILINSAGNAGMGPWKKILFPADAHNILTVGAISPECKNAPFSGVGPTQDGRVKPDVMALGSPATLISGRGSIVRDMGTSFSTPVVSGLVACLWQALPEMTALEMIELIRKNCNSYKNPDNIYGYGIPNFWRAYMVGKLEEKQESTEKEGADGQ